MGIKNRKRTAAAATGLFLGAAALTVFLFRLRGQWGGLCESVQAVRYRHMAPALLFIALMYVLRILRWRSLLNPIASVPVGHITGALFIGLLGNNTLPARAGELIRPYVLQRRSAISFSRALASVVLDRTFDVAGILILMVFTGLMLLSGAGTVSVFPDITAGARGPVIIALIGLAATLGLLVILLCLPEMFARAAKRVSGALPRNIRAPVSGFIDSLVESAGTIQNRRSIAWLMSLSAGAWFAQAVSTYFVARGLGLEVGPGAAFLTTSAVCLAIALPQAPGYLGTYHLAAVLAIESFNIARAPAAAFAVVLWAVNILPVTVLSLFFLVREGMAREVFSENLE